MQAHPGRHAALGLALLAAGIAGCLTAPEEPQFRVPIGCNDTDPADPGPTPASFRTLYHIENRGGPGALTLCLLDADQAILAVAQHPLDAGQTLTAELATDAPVAASVARIERDGQAAVHARTYSAPTCDDGSYLHAAWFDVDASTRHGAGSLDGAQECPTAEASLFPARGVPGWLHDADRILLLGVAASALTMLVLWTRRESLLPLKALFSRLQRNHLLDEPTRQRIREAVAADPGVHASLLARRLGLSRGRVHYHLDVLVREGLLLRDDAFGTRHHFVAGHHTAQERRRLAALRHRPLARVVRIVEAQPGQTVSALSGRLGWPLHRASRTVGRLAALGLLERRPDGRHVRLFPKT